MLESSWLLIEGAAIALPTATTALYSSSARRKLREALHAPLFWDGGQAVSLATIYAELNGEVDLVGAIGEALGEAPPANPRDLARAVERLQASPERVRALVLDAATEAVLCTTVSTTTPAAAGVATMEKLAALQAQMGFFAFMGVLNSERLDGHPALLPVQAILPGGLPTPPPGSMEPGFAPPVGVLGVLAAAGLGRDGEWLPGVFRAVEGLIRVHKVKKARDQFHRALSALGVVAGEGLRKRTPAGQVLRRNVYSPLDAYRNLTTQARARAGNDKQRWIVPTVQQGLHLAFLASLARATTLVADKCQALERTLLGREGAAHAGETLWRHREVLMAGLAPDALPFGPVETALADYMRSQEESQTTEA